MDIRKIINRLLDTEEKITNLNNSGVYNQDAIDEIDGEICTLINDLEEDKI